MVLFAPHVGVCADGNVGKVYRAGQANSSSACGAAIGAYNAVKDNPEAATPSGNFIDAQMDTIKHLVFNKVDKVKTAED